jgi:sterol carrier protein 2
MTRRLADKVFASAGANRDDVGVVELHDCFAANEVCIVLSAREIAR